MASMAATAMAAAAGGNALSAYGKIKEGEAAQASANYNAAVQRANAAQAKSNQQLASQAGMAQEGMVQQKTRAESGQTVANQAGSGIDVNSGSAVDVQASEAELGQLDAMTIRSNATKEAYGYQVQEVNDKSQANLDVFEGKNAKKASYIAATSTLLGGASDASTSYQKYKMAGSF